MTDHGMAGRRGLGSQEGAGRFRLIRYFTVTSLAAFVLVAIALYFLEFRESAFFKQVQRGQGAFFAQVQQRFAEEQQEASRRELLLVHEASHVNLTRVLANALWESDLAPFIARASQIPVEQCRSGPAAARAACYAEVGARLRALPGFAALDARMSGAMKSSSVFKFKVFDLRGVTVYSSEHAQIGEDKRDNQGWVLAVRGIPASELTHRDKFSAFEGVVENRDLISSYVPAFGPGGDVVGVFEIYSDVTPFLARIKAAGEELAIRNNVNQAAVEKAARENQQKVETSSYVVLATVGGLLALLYLALLLIVRHAQRVIDRQAQAQERAIRREARWHREKMAALAAMSANYAHEIGNPLAIISALAEDMAERNRAGEPSRGQPEVILEQVQRIAKSTRQLSDFAAARSATLEPHEVNPVVRSVCEFLTYDQRFRSTQIDFVPGEGLPARVIIPDHLTEALMNLLDACVNEDPDAGPAGAPASIRVETAVQGDDVVLRLGCGKAGETPPQLLRARLSDPRVEAARRRIAGMGGQLVVGGEGAAAFEMILPPHETDPAPAAQQPADRQPCA